MFQARLRTGVADIHAACAIQPRGLRSRAGSRLRLSPHPSRAAKTRVPPHWPNSPCRLFGAASVCRPGRGIAPAQVDMQAGRRVRPGVDRVMDGFVTETMLDEGEGD